MKKGIVVFLIVACVTALVGRAAAQGECYPHDLVRVKTATSIRELPSTSSRMVKPALAGTAYGIRGSEEVRGRCWLQDRSGLALCRLHRAGRLLSRHASDHGDRGTDTDGDAHAASRAPVGPQAAGRVLSARCRHRDPRHADPRSSRLFQSPDRQRQGGRRICSRSAPGIMRSWAAGWKPAPAGYPLTR